MGRKLHLTMCIHRSNERQNIKERKLQMLKLAEEARKVNGDPLESKGNQPNLIIVIVIIKVLNPR